ncbi:copper amine oxidase N-terminal domain-containing protein [Paenibacillus aurantiacus]|uniref:Copper amine oxidase N-terminal domain-containing protein n=1 Tax=Paenibacillus aurantiacus TaxID=1936118 RepID=A0ABV5KMF9_9BACL
MKKLCIVCLFLMTFLFMLMPSTYAAEVQIKIDGVLAVSDVKAESKNNRTMVPLRIVSENLGASVEWNNTKVFLKKNSKTVELTTNSASALKDGTEVQLDVQPYLKNNRVMVPLRFIAEAFDCSVKYRNSIITIDSKPLVIDGMVVKALQNEYNATMGGVVQQVNGNAYSETIYNIFMANMGDKVDAPKSYYWKPSIMSSGEYYQEGQYDFIGINGQSIERFDIYSLVGAEKFPKEPKVLVYNANADAWFLFNETAASSIKKYIEIATRNGFLTIISNDIP